MKSSWAAGLLLFTPLWAQTGQNKLEVLLPAGTPLSVVSSEWGESQARAQGAGMLIDLKTSVRFRNDSKLRLRGISLEVKTEQVAAGGKASLSVPSLDVYPGQDFPVRIDLRLLQPAGKANAAVRVYLDGVLFEDLSFFGPNHLQSRRTLTAWELEARRDRQWLRQVLSTRGENGLRQEILEALARDTQRPQVDFKMARGPASLGGGETVKLAFRRQAESPVEGFATEAVRKGQELQIPEIRVANRAEREIRFVEYMLLARDGRGRMMAAGSLPSPVQLKAKEQGTLRGNVSIQLSRREGGPIEVLGLTGVVQRVEYANGDIWIPSFQGLEDTGLRTDLPPSIELQRLADIYRKRNMAVLIVELKRFD